MAVLDASVVVALFSANEPHHAASREWLVQATAVAEPLIAPVIVLAEVAAALSRAKGDPALAQQVIQLLGQGGLFELVPISLALAEQAAAVAISAQIRGCDAVYVALAQQLNQTLITLDHEQLARNTAVIRVQTP
ncbi:MAG: type II toxin-antitoxin system VapC family toxin [Chloroflexi bacterium]|nr:type II toxin-antitoxin system VapC family toxin [Chloroflexota bacterium]